MIADRTRFTSKVNHRYVEGMVGSVGKRGLCYALFVDDGTEEMVLNRTL